MMVVFQGSNCYLPFGDVYAHGVCFAAAFDTLKIDEKYSFLDVRKWHELTCTSELTTRVSIIICLVRGGIMKFSST